MKDSLHAYLKSAVEMRAMLAQRTPDEVAYDNDVLAGLRKGWPIRKALKGAVEKHPLQALQWTEDTIAGIQEHYEWQLRHEDIMAKARAAGFREEVRVSGISHDAPSLSFVALDRVLDGKLATDPQLAADLAAKGRGCLRFGRVMTDGQLVDKLRSFGVELCREAFAEIRPRFLSAEELSNRLAGGRTPKLNDNDWLWVCTAVLWERWFPDAPSLEMLDDDMQKGYRFSENGDQENALTVWLEVWNSVTAIMDARGIRTLDAFDRTFRGSQSVLNWVQDVETELLNACWQTGAHCEDRVSFCGEVIARMAEKDSSMIENMRLGIADSHVRLGNRQQADALFEGWLKTDPEWGWGWIGWSDGYALFTRGSKDYPRAEEVLKQGLAVPRVRDRDDILDRLIQIYEETGRNEEAGRIRDRLERNYGTASDKEGQEAGVHHHGLESDLNDSGSVLRHAPSSPAPSKKIGRNDPCPCGSGKKFKKCCGG
jgi:tetratricopeptide (TPR) repeat protein